jgi:hypothetical protein
MKPFPEEHELTWLFESQPRLTDKDVIWFYNELAFTTQRGSDYVECVISPAYGELKFRWSRDGVELVNLDVKSVAGLEVIKAKGADLLKAVFKEGSGLRPLLIKLKPNVWISWGAGLD